MSARDYENSISFDRIAAAEERKAAALERIAKAMERTPALHKGDDAHAPIPEGGE